MAVVAADREAHEEPQQVEQEEGQGKGMNPLDPRFSEYDPKKREYIYTRYSYRRGRDINLDLDEESPVGPMVYTDKVFPERFFLPNTMNVVSVKIVSSDYGYPLHVYGTIIVRDSIDRKCIYMFRRGKDNCQLISSKDDSLILTGPKRGLMFCDWIFFEIDLKVKDVHGMKVKDERLSKGLMELDGVLRLPYPTERKVQMETLVSMHSILDLSYIFIRNAVEGTVEVRILDGPAGFHGKIYARTTNVPCDIMLLDSEVNGMLTAGDKGVVQMARSVVGVSVDERLQVTVAAALEGDELSVCTVEFMPRRSGYDIEEIACGNYKILLKVTWSMVCF
ncbi:uncharacterized protein LOC124672867 [Lolium rigidum]|uniref:uncharacterized protein LOC124672867 n=1 Tax=Lolium rigidum TaxID=89674 RepID=UPI001F5CC71A|nr:uncharacterized protein LOC124672867 [Lolium rigidum]